MTTEALTIHRNRIESCANQGCPMRNFDNTLADATLPTDDAVPLVTPASALSDRLRRERDHAAACVLLALVTSTNIAADLIDQAVEHSR